MCELTQVCLHKTQLQKEKYHEAANSISRFFRASVKVYGVSVTCTKNFKMLDIFWSSVIQENPKVSKKAIVNKEKLLKVPHKLWVTG